MKKRMLRLFTLVLALALCAPLFVQGTRALTGELQLPDLDDGLLNALSPNSAAYASLNEFFSETIDESVFIICLTDGTDYWYISAFYMEDTQGDGSTYLVTSYLSKGLLDNGFIPVLLGMDGYQQEATYITTVGYFSFYTAPGLENFTPLKTGTQFTDPVYFAIQDVSDSGMAGVDYYSLELSDTEYCTSDAGAFYYFPGTEIGDLFIGVPIFNSENYGLIGCMDIYDGDYEIVIRSLIDLDFPAEAAIVKGTAQATAETEPASPSEPASQSESESQPQTSQTEQEDDGGSTGTTTVGTLLVIAVIAAVIFAVTRKKSPKKEKRETTPAVHGTISLDPEPVPQPGPIPHYGTIPQVAAKFQVRGVGGMMNGRVFPLNGSLRFGRDSQCGVVFPQNSPGISGNHCELTMENGQAVLRDNNSSYGTYLTGGVKLEPGVAYHLQLGDVFTLAEGGQSFRLENIGDSMQELTPAVRAADGGRVYRADLQGRITFGRDPRCQVPFDASDTAISSSHCVLYRSGAELYLMDTGSTNGTFLGENKRLRPNKPYRVSRGQAFFLCSPKYTFVIIEA